MKEELKHRMMQQIELTLLKLHHVPFIVSKRQKMAVWSDIREVLFMKCTHLRCSVVLSALKSHLRYPLSEKFMHPCSLSEQLQFMKKFMVVSPGTLLVDLNSIGDRFELMKLYDMVKIKHDTSGDVTIKRCRELSERKKYDKHAHYYSDNPLRNLTKKIFLPSIQRKSNKDYCEQRDGRLIQSVLYNSFGEEASSALIPMYLLKETYPASVGVLEEAVRLYIIGQSEQASLASVGQCTRDEGYHFSRFMAMQFGFGQSEQSSLASASQCTRDEGYHFSRFMAMQFGFGQSEQSSLASASQCTRDEGYHFSRFMAMQFGFGYMYASVGVQEEAVRLYVLGQSEQASLASVGQCTRDEGYHFSRFMAMQFGFEKQWPCFTSSSLLISWEEFWLTNSRNTDVNIVPNINVSVVTLNCQVKEGTRQNIQPANHNSKTSSKQPCIMNAQAVKMEKTLENEIVKLKETELGFLYSKGNMQNSQMSLKEKHMSLSNEKDLLLHQEATRESTKPGPCSLKKSKSYTLSLSKSLKLKMNSPRLSNSYTMLPDINAAKLSQNAETDENNSDKSKGEIEKRVTRSKSYNTVRTNRQENGSIKTDKNKTCMKKIQGINPDSNNSAVLDAIIKKKGTENVSGYHLDSDKKNTESHQDLSVSQESVTAGQATFDMGSFDVSITTKKKHIEADEGEQKEDIKPKLRVVEGRTSPSKRYNDRKNLKISSAKFSDNIPDLLRVGKKVANVDNNLCYEKQRSLGSKGIAVPDTNINNLTESVDNKEGGIATKSIELSVVSPKANTKGKDFIACKTKPLKQAKKKDALIDNDTYPMVSGVKLQNSPTKVRDRPTCKSAGTLPGPLNTIPIKPMSATLDRTGKLPTEIVSNLKKQATNSICSVLGNSDAKTLKDIVASGKEIISPRKNETKTSADFSDFQTERIIMWRDNLEKFSSVDSSLESSRACKSADTSSRKERPYTYRPSSSIYYPSYSDQKTGFGPSIKTGLCILMSRDRNKSSKLSSIRNTYQVPKRQISPKKKESTPASTEVDTPNYGSSSSKSPDIYDEFARKKKLNRGAKQDMQIVKGKQMSCEQKYVQNIPLYKMKYLDGRNKPLENSQEMLTQADNVSMAGSRKQHKLFEYSPPEMLDSTNKNVPLHQFQNKASNETRNLPVSSNLYRIMDANLAKRSNLYQCSQDESGNESNSNQYTSCSMCWHESHIADGSEISQHDDNAILTELKMSPSSLSNAMTTELSMFTTQDENIQEGKPTLADLGQNHFESHESILERLNRVDEEAQSCADDQDKNSDLEDIDTSRRIKLLDKMNMFVDGVSDPHESGSLENIENIKSIIKINPIVSQNQLSARFMEQHLLNESLQIHVQNGQEIPNVMIKDRRDTEDENITGGFVNQVSDGQVLVDNGADTCYTEVSSNDTESDSKGEIHVSEKHSNYAKFEYDLDMTDQIELIDNTRRQSPGEKIIDNFSDKYSVNKEYEDHEESNHDPKENSHTSKGETVNIQGKSREKKRRKNKHINTESKSFKEVVEEKRASKKKAELELTKKKFWKSANPCHQQSEDPKCESNPSPKKKIIIKTLSEDNTGVQKQQKQSSKIDKKKRPKTCPTYTAKTREKDATKDHLSKIYTSNGKKKTKVKEYKNSVSDSEQMKSGPKKPNSRVLRSNTVKSAKSERSCRRKKRSPVKIPTEDTTVCEEDVTHNVIENTKNTNQGPVESKKFKARQRKLRLKVHNNCNPQKSKSAIQGDDVPQSESAEASFEEVDDSNIICETVHAENILEIPDDQSEDNIDNSGMITFITQTPDLPFQQDPSNINSSLFGEMTNQDYMSYLQTDREDYSFPASDVLKTNVDSESANNEAANDNGFSFEDNLLTYNDGLRVGSGDLNFYHSQEGDSMKNIDLSELPESVLEVVLSDNLINMATMPSPHTYEIEGKELSIINQGRMAELHEQEIDRNTDGNANINAEDVYVTNQGQYTENELDYFRQTYEEMGDSNMQSSGSTIVSQENAPENINLPLDQVISEDVSQNAITVLHPNGGKIILPKNHPAFEIFTNVFVQNFGYPEEGQHLSSQEEVCSEYTDLIPAPIMANENEIQEEHLESVTHLHGVEEFSGGTDEIGNKCEEIYYCDKNDDTLTQDKQCPKRVPYKEITRESVTRCFNKLALMRPEATSKESTTHTHSDNIFDALRKELTKTAKGNIANELKHPHPNIDIKEKTQVEIGQDDTDFEKEIIGMMRESFERKISSTKEIDKDSTTKRILQLHSNSRQNLPTIRQDHYHRNTNGQEIKNCFVTLGRKCDNMQQNEAEIEESEAQPQQDIERSDNADSEENNGNEVASGKIHEYSDTPDCPDSPETVKYGDDSCSDISGSDFQPYSSDESTDADSYDLNSDESSDESEKSISDDDEDKGRTKQKLSKIKTSHHKNVSRQKIKQKKSKNKKENKNRNKNSESETQLKQGVNGKRKHKKVRKHKLKRQTKADTMVDVDEDKDEDKDGHDDTVTINSLVTTQRLYLDILQNSTGKADTQQAHTERNADNLEDILSEGFMLKRDRDLSRLETEAERQREGTGSLADLERDDTRETIVNDPSTNCRYQVVEDEDGITLGGVVYYNEYILPFVYINGYKYTPLKDAATLFQPECCAWKCRIPKNVMTKNKQLFKTYSTWEQVYKLELIKMKKGPPIKTGDVLVKFDSFVSLLPSLLLDIIAQHKNSKLKYSQDCDMKSYKALQNRINLDLKKGIESCYP